MTYKRFFVRIVALVVIAAILSSSAFILLEADHECLEDRCLICDRIAMCIELIRVCLCAVVFVVLIRFAERSASRLLYKAEAVTSPFSPITLKVKLTD